MVESLSRSKTHSAKCNVLVLEDNEAFRELLIKQLKSLGCSVQVSTDAGQFLSELATAEMAYDLAVVDIQLPGLNGDHVISWIRESELSELNSLPVLIVTGSPYDLSETLINQDSIFMLKKPYEYRELKAAISQLSTQGARH